MEFPDSLLRRQLGDFAAGNGGPQAIPKSVTERRPLGLSKPVTF